MPLTRKRAASDRMLLSERRKLAKLVDALLKSLEARPGERCYYADGGDSREWMLPTPLGDMRCLLSGNAFFCRFMDITAAVNAFGRDIINPYSGKYNTYVFERIDANTAMAKIIASHLAWPWRKAGVEVPKPIRDWEVQY
jgi:hypothetical protein